MVSEDETPDDLLEKYMLLYPTKVGYIDLVDALGDKTGERRHGFQMETLEPLQSGQHPRIGARPKPEHLSRFKQDSRGLDHVIWKASSKEYSLEYIFEWVNDQTKGAWSVMFLVDCQKRTQQGVPVPRAGMSRLVFFFENKDDAVLFKLFQCD